MFIKTSTRKKDGKIYQTQYLAEGYREKKTGQVRHRHILSLSKLPPDMVIALKNFLKNGPSTSNISLKDLEVISSKEYGSVKTFSIIFDKYFKDVINNRYSKEIKAIVINRILEPKSKNGLKNWLNLVDFNYILSKNKIYKCLDYLEENQQEIEKQLFKRHQASNIDLLLYDITSTYFHGKGTENICKHGYSRDHRKDKVQVNIGLVTNSKGKPISVEVFAGNISDKQTIQNKIKDLIERFKIKNITFVFDRGMKSKVNLEYIQKQGYDYITALSHSELKQKTEENKKIQLGLFDKKNLAEFEIDNEKYVLCHNPYKAQKDKFNRIELIKRIEKRLIQIQNFKRNYSDLELQNKVSKNINKFKCEKYVNYEIKDNKLIFELNIEKIKHDEQFDGFYMLKTTNDKLTKEQANKKYKSLRLVEKAFNDIKNHIEIRPVFHYKEARIKGHIFACFMAYYLLHEFKEQVKDLLKEHRFDDLLTELKIIKKNYLKIDNTYLEKLTTLTPVQENLLKRFKVPYRLL